MPSVRSSREMEGHEAAAGFDRVLLLAFCVVGIWSAYIYQVVLQETVSTKLFGPDGKRSEHLSSLNLAQNAVCFLWSLIMIKLWSRNSSGVAPLWSGWSPNISNTIGPSMGIEALITPHSTNFINSVYLLSVLAKSTKMIPVMLMGTLVYGIKYTIPEYICTFLVAGGVSSFALSKVRWFPLFPDVGKFLTIVYQLKQITYHPVF
ncbi:unnamed protein product [Musa acuminata var. zebrina]